MRGGVRSPPSPGASAPLTRRLSPRRRASPAARPGRGGVGGWGGGGGGGRGRASASSVLPTAAAPPPPPPRVTGGQRRGSSEPNGGGAAIGVEVRGWPAVGLATGAGRPPRPHEPSTLPPLQVPSAFRRGGLKTLGGSPVRPGSGADGPRGEPGGLTLLPNGSAPPAPHPAGGRGGGGGGRREPPGACGVPVRGPAGPARGRPVVETSRPHALSVLVSRWPAGGAPPNPPHPRGARVCVCGGGIVPCQEENQKERNA